MASLLGLFKDTLGIDFFNPASQLWGLPASPALALPSPPSQLSAAGVAHTCRITPFISLKEAKKNPLPPRGQRDVMSQPLPLTEWGVRRQMLLPERVFLGEQLFTAPPLQQLRAEVCEHPAHGKEPAAISHRVRGVGELLRSPALGRTCQHSFPLTSRDGEQRSFIATDSSRAAV